MTVEITAVNLQEGVVVISCIDCSEKNLSHIMRNRDDGGFQRDLDIIIDTKVSYQYNALRRWLKKQSCTTDKKTWGAALQSIVGIITETYGIGKYIVWG